MGLLRRWAIYVLRDKLRERDQTHARYVSKVATLERTLNEYRAERDQLQRERDEARRHNVSLLSELLRARRERDGAALARVEAELLSVWRRMFEALETEDAVDEAGDPICRKVKLHSRREAMRWAAHVNRTTDYPAPLEAYQCEYCAPHPLVERVWHVRHVDPELRGLTTRERALYYAARPLTETLGDALPDDVKARLSAKFQAITERQNAETTSIVQPVDPPTRLVDGSLSGTLDPVDQSRPRPGLSLDQATRMIETHYGDALDELGRR